MVLRSNFALFLTMQFASLISLLINIISLDVTSFNSAVTLKLKCGKVVCVEFFIFGDRSSAAYRATENLSRSFFGFLLLLFSSLCPLSSFFLSLPLFSPTFRSYCFLLCLFFSSSFFFWFFGSLFSSSFLPLAPVSSFPSIIILLPLP